MTLRADVSYVEEEGKNLPTGMAAQIIASPQESIDIHGNSRCGEANPRLFTPTIFP